MKKTVFSLACLCVLFCQNPLLANDRAGHIDSSNNGEYLKKVDVSSVDLTSIFSVDLRKDADFLKAIDNSINFYSSMLDSDELFWYGEESYTPIEMFYSLLMFKKMVTVERPYEEFLTELKNFYDIYLASDDTKGSKLTGYYTPYIEASTTKTAVFNYPLYLKKPKLKSSQPDFYVKARDAVRALEMEGAGILTLDNGETLNIQYAGRKRAIDELSKKRVIKKIVKKNGKKKSILVKVKKPPKTKAVFYVTDTKALGSLSMELVPKYSAAMDMSKTPAGSIIYVKTKENKQQSAENTPFESFMLVHDIGSAIKGAGRVDIYCGEGSSAHSCTFDVTARGLVYLLIAKKDAIMNFILSGIR